MKMSISRDVHGVKLCSAEYDVIAETVKPMVENLKEHLAEEGIDPQDCYYVFKISAIVGGKDENDDK